MMGQLEKELLILYNERQNEIAMSETYENLNVGICDFSKSWNRTYWFIFLPESKQNSKVDPTTICSTLLLDLPSESVGENLAHFI